MAIRTDTNGEGVERTASLPASNAFTVTGWSYVDADTGSANYQQLFEISDGVSNYLGLYWEGPSSDVMTIERASESTNLASRPATGGWFFWALSATTGYWVNPSTLAVVSASVTATSFTPVGMSLHGQAAGQLLNGRLAAVKMWDANLTQAEILAEMWTYLPQRTTNLHAVWPLFLHTSLVDYSGNGRTLTAVGTLSTVDGPPIAWGTGRNRTLCVSAAAPPAGRTTKNTRAFPLGMELGMNLWGH